MIALLRIGLLIACMMSIACSESEPPTTPNSTPAPPITPTGEPSSKTADGGAPAQTPANAPPAQEADDPAALATRGRAVYTANCIACHNPDPSLEGGIGPAIAGSTLELLEARVMRNEYPEGYKPKRETKAMIPLPYLEKDLAALAAFLAR